MTHDELLLELLVAPNDAALRAVYVDLLLESGDPRAEHVRLVRNGRLREAAALEHALGHRWIPLSLARFVTAGSCRFRDGLLDACALREMTGDEARLLATEPLWAAVRALGSPPLAVLEQAKHLEALYDVDHARLLELAAMRLPLKTLTHLGLRLGSTWSLLESLVALDAPRLSSLSLRLTNEGLNARHNQRDEIGAQCCEECARPAPHQLAPSLQPERLADLFTSPLGAKLDTLELHVGWVDLARFVPALEATRCDVKSVRLRGVEEPAGVPAWSLRLDRTAPGRYRSLTIEHRGVGDDRLDWGDVLATTPDFVELIK